MIMLQLDITMCLPSLDNTFRRGYYVNASDVTHVQIFLSIYYGCSTLFLFYLLLLQLSCILCILPLLYMYLIFLGTLKISVCTIVYPL